MILQLLILVDVFSQSLTITKDKEIKLVPINNLQSSKRGNMIIHVTSHLQRLVKILNKKGLPMGKLVYNRYLVKNTFFRQSEKGSHPQLSKQ